MFSLNRGPYGRRVIRFRFPKKGKRNKFFTNTAKARSRRDLPLPLESCTRSQVAIFQSASSASIFYGDMPATSLMKVVTSKGELLFERMPTELDNRKADCAPTGDTRSKIGESSVTAGNVTTAGSTKLRRTWKVTWVSSNAEAANDTISDEPKPKKDTQKKELFPVSEDEKEHQIITKRSSDKINAQGFLGSARSLEDQRHRQVYVLSEAIVAQAGAILIKWTVSQSVHLFNSKISSQLSPCRCRTRNSLTQLCPSLLAHAVTVPDINETQDNNVLPCTPGSTTGSLNGSYPDLESMAVLRGVGGAPPSGGRGIEYLTA